MVGVKTYSAELFPTKPFNLDDFVPANDFYRFFNEHISLNFLYEEVKPYYGTTGNPSIDPVVFFKLLIVAAVEGISQVRKLMRRANDSYSIRLFLGYRHDEKLPDHSTLSKTRARLPKEIYDKLFNMILRLAMDHGLIEGSHLSVDSTLVKANASKHSIEPVTLSIDSSELLGILDAEMLAENKASQVNTQDIQETINDEEKKIVSESQRNSKKKKEVVSRGDVEAKSAKNNSHKFDFYYKVQMVTDSKKGIIIDAESYAANTGDNHLLLEAVQRSDNLLNELGCSLSEVSADMGYFSGKNIRELQAKGITAFIPRHKSVSTLKEFNKGDFRYDEVNDHFICPNNKILKRKGKHQDGSYYSAKKSDCKNCPLREKCTDSKAGRTLLKNEYEHEFEIIEKRMKTPAAKKAAKIRRTNAERVFAEAKEHRGMRKLFCKGLDKASKNSVLIASAMNLLKIFKAIKRPKKVNIAQKSDFKGHLLEKFYIIARLIKRRTHIYDKDSYFGVCCTF